MLCMHDMALFLHMTLATVSKRFTTLAKVDDILYMAYSPDTVHGRLVIVDDSCGLATGGTE